DVVAVPHEKIDRYRLEELVGTGGMSQVYRAWDTSLDREVAVKLLHPHLAAKEESRRRLSREARAVAKLHHPNILEIYDFSGDGAQNAYIVTEFIRGRTLRRFAEEVGFGMPTLGALAGHSLAMAIEHAHALGIVHRDIKPENVMVRDDGVLKLMDFGIARIIDHGERMTMTGTLVGSPAHMAPEIIEGQEADARSDVFSLGTMLYWLCTGQLPFAASHTTAVLKRILDGQYEDPRALCPAISDSLCACLRGALERDPAQRLPSAAELRRRLEAALVEDGLERPTEELHRFFSDPSAYRAAHRAALIERLGGLARDALAQGKPSRTLSLVNRLLALDPDSGLARELLRRIAGRRRARRALLAVAALVAGFVGGHFAWSALTLWRAEHPSLVTAPAPSAEVEPSPPLPKAKAIAAPAPLRAPSQPEPPIPSLPGATKRPRVAREAHEPTAPPPKVAPGTLQLFVQPYADVVIDGTRRAAGVPALALELAAGSHSLELIHPDCEPWQRPLSIAPNGATSLRVKLTPKPALLEIHGAPPDADVMVDGAFRGTAALSLREPFRVSLEDRPGRTVSVRVFKPGFVDFVRDVPVRANERVSLSAPLAQK
ncbi:MAG: serine/threonine-protein kinase, partial [Deltaproteobacteria bacterium]